MTDCSVKCSVDREALSLQLCDEQQTITVLFHSFARLERAIERLGSLSNPSLAQVIELFELEGAETISAIHSNNSNPEPTWRSLGRDGFSTATNVPTSMPSATPPQINSGAATLPPQGATGEAQRTALFALTVVCAVNAFALSLSAINNANGDSRLIPSVLSAINLVAAVVGVVLHWRNAAHNTN